MVGGRRLPPEKVTEPRGAERQRLRVPATVVLPTGEQRQIMIEDLSSSGFAAITDTALAEDTVFKVGLTPGRARVAKVVWSEADRAGCEFLTAGEEPQPGAAKEEGATEAPTPTC